jgi:predicted permease
MRAYRALLRLFPSSFRHEYGGEMVAIFSRRLRDTRGAAGTVVLWMETLADVLGNALRVHVDILRQDLRFSARSLGRSRGFAAAAILVSALGIGATTATFSLTDHVLLRPLPFPEPERLVQLWQTQLAKGYGRVELSPANYRDWKHTSTSFEAMGAMQTLSTNLGGDGEPERLEGAAVTADLLPMLGTPPLLGRSFLPEEDREGADGTVLLSYGLWQKRFGGDPGVVGRELILDGAPYVVIGVMPRPFHFPRRETQLWTATRFDEDDYSARDNLYVYAFGRLKRGVSLEAARAEMHLVAAQLEQAYPGENAGMGASVLPLRDFVTPQSRLLLVVLFGAGLAVLLIACTNLASLFLARALQRRREISVRAALGAGRDRLVRQLLTEATLLAFAGGTLGVFLAVSALPLVVKLVPHSLPIAEAPPLDARVLGFAALMTVVTALGFGLAPAFRGLRDADAEGLREGSRAGTGRDRERLRSALVVAEVAVSIVLLVSAGLLLRALARLQDVDPGFRSEGVLTARTWLPLPAYEPTERRAQFYRSVLEGVRSLPGITGAAYISFLPMVMRGGIWSIETEGQNSPGQHTASLRFVTPGFFDVMRIPIQRGRDVSESDTGQALPVAVVSASFAERHWPGQDPLGRRFHFGLLGSGKTRLGPFQDRTVVGVVGDIRVRGLERASEPQVYLPYRQVPDGAMIWFAPKDLVVRSTADTAAFAPFLRKIVARVDPAQPVSDVRSLDSIVEAETAPRKVQVRVLGAFAAVAVLLAGIGIHGLLAFAVSARTPEIGVRLALGASARDILGLVLRQGLILASTGVLLGLALAFAAGQGLQAVLAGVSPRDSLVFLTATAVALAMALAGGLLPALRALHVDPLTAIRAE